MSVKEFLIAFIENQKSYKKLHLCLHYTFLIFLNTVRESDKSYMINHENVFWPLVFLFSFFIKSNKYKIKKQINNEHFTLNP